MMGGGIRKEKEVVIREDRKQAGYRFERIDFNILTILRTR